MLSVLHRIAIPAPQTHIVHVETTITGELPRSLVMFMPVWTPGSYLVREYARHVEALTAEAPAVVTKIRKNAWSVESGGAARVVVRYSVYANELTVRTSHVDDTHAFLVGAALFMGIEGHERLGARVEIEAPREWRVSTALEAAGAGFVAHDFDALVDCPIELGTHREERFDVLGKPHRYTVWPAGVAVDADIRRLVDDTSTIVKQEAGLFGGTLPYDKYEMLLHLTSRGRGGLEHAASAALVASPAAFATRDGYLDLLSLVAHELFHAWNVKRIRPEGLAPYRYQEECYTRLLWWFEGGTSYYDWRVLRLARLCTVDEYLDHLATEVAYLDHTPGRLVHALEDASFDAWVKLYRPDENTANSTVSYYRKGELVCALLDIEIRARTGGRATLDHVLAALWREYGLRNRPVPENGMQEIFESVAGVPLGDLFDAWIRSAAELDLGPTLARVGLSVERSARADAAPCALGVRVRLEGGRTMVAAVTRDSAAWHAGIDPGDELIAIGGARVEGVAVDATLRNRSPGDVVDVVLSRDGRLVTKRPRLDRPRHDRVKIVAVRDASPAARQALLAWLGDLPSAWAPAADVP
jgi:predicted metalloprotease with PDZ domain